MQLEDQCLHVLQGLDMKRDSWLLYVNATKELLYWIRNGHLLPVFLALLHVYFGIERCKRWSLRILYFKRGGG